MEYECVYFLFLKSILLLTSSIYILGSEVSVLLWKAAKLLKSKECINTLYFTIALK